ATFNGHSTRVIARSSGQQVRGVKHDGIRPTKVVIDDVERPDRVRGSLRRKELWEYLTTDVLKCGDKFTVYDIVGTILHPDSALAACLRLPGWASAKWQAVLKWPKNAELWEECRAIWCDLTKGDQRAEL